MHVYCLLGLFLRFPCCFAGGYSSDMTCSFLSMACEAASHTLLVPCGLPIPVLLRKLFVGDCLVLVQVASTKEATSTSWPLAWRATLRSLPMRRCILTLVLWFRIHLVFRLASQWRGFFCPGCLGCCVSFSVGLDGDAVVCGVSCVLPPPAPRQCWHGRLRWS